ncbi:MAG: penicillin acylase family protein [Pyrinomonadaceae bacterium]|nr:penicillin acylase family protein [Pyrinomonadaceae bacterium]MBP6212372.1 penicillin acylase family protein [Pyrinomonadaceae bacterium]
MKMIFRVLIPTALMSVTFFATSLSGQGRAVAPTTELWRQVEVIRTAHGVPHIRAENLRAAGYALAWLQSEDYGSETAMNVLKASGRWAYVEGYTRIESDFVAQRKRAEMSGKYVLLSKDVRDVYEGFAAGLNRYIALHPGNFPSLMPSDLTGFDVASTEIILPSVRKIRNFLNRMDPPANAAERPLEASQEEGDTEAEGPDDGSNAWAFAPNRTKSGKAILLRNPHLQWTAGYYEAHMTVRGVLDFYGDFRIGGPFAVIGGFNRYLGWSTTNNAQDLDEFYSLDVDPMATDRYLFDGRSVPLTRELVTVKFRNGEGLSTETREFWSTPLGPVVHRGGGKIYVYKYAGDGENRTGEQFLRMMRSKTLAEWKQAMKMRARPTSNFTYADRAGNIFFIWNAALPLLPKAPGDDLTAVPARGKADVWTKLVPFDELPQFLNPPGGYIHNENSSPHYTNVRGGVNTRNAYPNFEEPRLSLRSQLALQLIDNDEKYSLEDVVRLKHNYRALLADRVKPDLIAAVKASNPSGDVAAAIELLGRWDNTTSPASRGSVLFEIWWTHYSGIRPPERNIIPDNKRYARVWSVADPFNTPAGLTDKARAAESFVWAVAETKARYGSYDVAWGDVHRVRRGKVDVPVGGCGNDLGCFRILSFTRDTDGKLAANSGDGWVLAVEFGDTPRAYSVLAYGESRLPASPYHADQAEMFARGEMKKVAFTEIDVNAQAIVRFRPGQIP